MNFELDSIEFRRGFDSTLQKLAIVGRPLPTITAPNPTTPVATAAGVGGATGVAGSLTPPNQAATPNQQQPAASQPVQPLPVEPPPNVPAPVEPNIQQATSGVKPDSLTEGWFREGPLGLPIPQPITKGKQILSNIDKAYQAGQQAPEAIENLNQTTGKAQEIMNLPPEELQQRLLTEDQRAALAKATGIANDVSNAYGKVKDVVGGAVQGVQEMPAFAKNVMALLTGGQTDGDIGSLGDYLSANMGKTITGGIVSVLGVTGLALLLKKLFSGGQKQTPSQSFYIGGPQSFAREATASYRGLDYRDTNIQKVLQNPAARRYITQLLDNGYR